MEEGQAGRDPPHIVSSFAGQSSGTRGKRGKANYRKKSKPGMDNVGERKSFS